MPNKDRNNSNDGKTDAKGEGEVRSARITAQFERVCTRPLRTGSMALRESYQTLNRVAIGLSNAKSDLQFGSSEAYVPAPELLRNGSGLLDCDE